jgi:FAD/FMN-containing dehydrogenase
MAHAASRKISHDVCVPPKELFQLLRQIEALARRQALTIIAFGHLGDGNIHVNIMTDGGALQERRAAAAFEDIFRIVLSLGGTLSGEHGIGSTKAPYLSWELSAETLEAHRKVKAAFDPRGLLNPEKIFLRS